LRAAPGLKSRQTGVLTFICPYVSRRTLDAG
jgi:hypothetical protein